MCSNRSSACYPSATCTYALTSSPTCRCSATRTAFFTGSRYTPVLLSGKIDVRHEVAPIVTPTRTEPKPRRAPAVMSVIYALTSAGSETKCQPSAAGYRHSGAANSKPVIPVTGRGYGAPPTGLSAASTAAVAKTGDSRPDRASAGRPYWTSRCRFHRHRSGDPPPVVPRGPPVQAGKDRLALSA